MHQAQRAYFNEAWKINNVGLETSWQYFIFGKEREAMLKKSPYNTTTYFTPGGVEFYVTDHLGNTRVTHTPLVVAPLSAVDPVQTNIQYIAEYLAYGKILREYVADKPQYLTTQHERDNETGLDYRGARFYDADVARFLSLDPLANNFPAWSAYNYVIGNPIFFTDPTGLAPDEAQPNESVEFDDEYELGTNEGGWTKNHLMMNQAFGDGDFNSLIADRIGDGDGGKKKANESSTVKSGFEAVKTTGDIAGFASGGLGGLQIGMTSYRQSLPINQRINTSTTFFRTYRGIGMASRFFGNASNVGAATTVYLDYNAMQSGEISTSRFAFRTAGLGLSIGIGAKVGATFGGPWGAVAGTAVGATFTATEASYDGLNWLWNETSKQINNFKTGLSNGWYPRF